MEGAPALNRDHQSTQEISQQQEQNQTHSQDHTQTSSSSGSGNRGQLEEKEVQTDKSLIHQTILSLLHEDPEKFLRELQESVVDHLADTDRDREGTDADAEGGDDDETGEARSDRTTVESLLAALQLVRRRGDGLGGEQTSTPEPPPPPTNLPKTKECSFGCGTVGSGRQIRKHERWCLAKRNARLRAAQSQSQSQQQSPAEGDSASASSSSAAALTGHPPASAAPAVAVQSVKSRGGKVDSTAPDGGGGADLGPSSSSASASARPPPIERVGGEVGASARHEVSAEGRGKERRGERQRMRGGPSKQEEEGREEESERKGSVREEERDHQADGQGEREGEEEKSRREGDAEALFSWHPDVFSFGSCAPDVSHPLSATFTKTRHSGHVSLVYERALRTRGVHAYRFSVLKGNICATDGVAFVFGKRVPATKNVPSLNALLLSSNGHVSVRMHGGKWNHQTDTTSLPKVEKGSEVIMTIDLDEAVAVVEVVAGRTSEAEEGGSSTVVFDRRPAFSLGTLSAFRSVVGFKFVPATLRLSGHFCCLITDTGTTVSVGDAVPSRANDSGAVSAAAAAATVGLSPPPARSPAAAAAGRQEEGGEGDVRLVSSASAYPFSSDSSRGAARTTADNHSSGRNDSDTTGNGGGSNGASGGAQSLGGVRAELPSESGSSLSGRNAQTLTFQQQQMRYDPTATAVLAPALFVPGVTLPHGGTVPLDAIADGQPATHFQVLPPAKPSLRGFEHQQQQGHLRQQAEVSGAGMVGTPTPPSDLLSMATVQGIPLHQLYLRGQQLQHQRGGQEPSPSPSAAPFPPPSSSACGGQQGHQQQQPQPQQLAMSMPLSLGRERSRETETATVVAQTQPVSSSSAASQAYSPFQQQQGHYQQ